MADVTSFRVEGSNFIFATNFSGDPRKDPKFGSTARRGNIIINDMDMVDEMVEMGLNVRHTNPGEMDDPDTFVPTYYIPVTVKYRKRNGEPMPARYMPKVYLVAGDNEPTLLDENTIGIIDDIDVLDVKVMFEPYFNESNGKWTQTARVMYVTQDIGNDPFASQFARRGGEPSDF